MSKQQRIGQKFWARRRARELAAQFLYSLDIYPAQGLEPALELFLGAGSLAESEAPEVKEYCRLLARGAWERRAEADELLLRVVTGWRPERMGAMDRAVLRLTLFEGFLSPKLPPKAAISEALLIARVFGSEESPRFINGVLARVLRHVFPDQAAPARQAQRSQEKEERDAAPELNLQLDR